MKRRWLAFVLVVCMLVMNGAAASAKIKVDLGEQILSSREWVYSADTMLFGSSYNKIHNLELAAAALDGTMIFFGETFSFNDAVGPRDKEFGYLAAKNGRGVRVTGGGVSQLATTLYLAARNCDYLTIDPFMSYDEAFTDWYVENGEDAVVTDYDAGKDFTFTSWYDGVVYISAWVDDEAVYCTLELLDDLPAGYDCLISEAYTPMFGSDNKRHNILLASDMITGLKMEHGDHFSFNELVGPRSQEAGFYNAENGRGVRVRGGGVAQVASTVHLALKGLDCVSVDPFRTYGDQFVDGYVADSEDAVVTDYSAGYDFSFVYWGYGTLTIYLFENGDRLVCQIFEE